MSYVQRVLQPGEQVRHEASVHWIVYVPGALLLVITAAVLTYGALIARHMLFWQIVAGVLGVVGLALLIRELFTWYTTEIAVTNQRVIYKTGFIRRETNEMNMAKVESVRVDQSILGRLLDYGDVTIIGTGEGVEKLHKIAGPIELRNGITGV
ncbi:MAG: PH domain-containing protein [Hyphomicrobiales bacterium]|nr:PH domain-containing protein [Hyphomicrobiales bacterium]